MQVERRVIIFMSFAWVASVCSSAPSWGVELERGGWVPNVGALADGDLPLGDLWIFQCPRNGTFRLSVQTKDDFDDGRSGIDPLVIVADGRGNAIAAADEEVECDVTPVCGRQCPALEEIGCGSGRRHSIILRDAGSDSDTGEACTSGGGYELLLEVFDEFGSSLTNREVRLGGGPRTEPGPPWLRRAGFTRVGPRVDDAGVPSLASELSEILEEARASN